MWLILEGFGLFESMCVCVSMFEFRNFAWGTSGPCRVAFALLPVVVVVVLKLLKRLAAAGGSGAVLSVLVVAATVSVAMSETVSIYCYSHSCCVPWFLCFVCFSCCLFLVLLL